MWLLEGKSHCCLIHIQCHSPKLRGRGSLQSCPRNPPAGSQSQRPCLCSRENRTQGHRPERPQPQTPQLSPAQSVGRGGRGEPGRSRPLQAKRPARPGPAGRQSEPPPRFRSAGDRGVPVLSAAARGGGRRLHALFSDSIHLSKLIFDIHSDLEGRHGDNSRKVENNIIATNMNYWPPG